jgi:hypothetical protein
MSNNYWDDEEDDNDTTPANLEGNDLIKQLRKKARADEKRIKEMSEQLEGITKAQRESVIKKVLESKGVSPKAARMIANELPTDANEESISNWLDDNAEVFGLQANNQDNPEQTIDRAALRQQDIVTQRAVTPDRAEDALMRLNEATTAEDIIAMIHSGNF